MKLKTILITLIFIFLWVSVAFSQGFYRTAVHHYIHAGSYYTFSHIFDGVTDGASKYVLIQTGDLSVHFISGFTAGGQTEISFQENATVSANGTSMNTYNHLRSSDETALSKVFYGSTITSGGDVFAKSLTTGGTSSPSRVGGVSEQREEYVLKPNTAYLVNATNTSGGTIDISVSGSFYEMKGHY